MVDAVSKPTYEVRMRVPAPLGPRSRSSTDESVFYHS